MGLLMASCEFQPDVKPLVIPTAPPQPFSAFVPTVGAISQIPSQAAPVQPLGEIETPADHFGFPTALVWTVGALAAGGTFFGSLIFPRLSASDRPPIIALIFIAILLGLSFLFIEATLFIIESFLAGVTVVGAVLFGLFIAAITIFLFDFLIAYSVYFYRVASAPPNEKVTIDLNPLHAWGFDSTEK